MTVVADLLSLLELEPLEINIYRGQNRDLCTGRVFGGQVFAQALVAARRTVDEPREAHSVHGYFLRALAISRRPSCSLSIARVTAAVSPAVA